MKRITFGALALALPLAALAAAENYTLDPYHTYPHFAVEHLGVSMLWGRFNKTSGKFTLDRAAKKASLELTVETASVSTGDADKGSRARSLDEHLRNADFFNAAEFPRMTFRGADVKFSGDQPTEMTGELTLRGRVLPIGGLKEKLIAAARAGVKTVLVPARNQSDLVEVPDEVKQLIEIKTVETLDQVLEAALLEPRSPRAVALRVNKQGLPREAAP